MAKPNIKEFEHNNAEFGVDSRYQSRKEKLVDGRALMESRQERMKNLSFDQVIKARLLQLKLKMQEFFIRKK